MKYSVLVKPKVMVRLKDIEADSQEDAARMATQIIEKIGYQLFRADNPQKEVKYTEFADGELTFEVLVDEVGDEEFERSEWYNVDLLEGKVTLI